MDTEQRKHIAATIRAARLRKGWTVTEAARHLGAGESNWSRWETGAAIPRPATMLELAELLDLPADWTTLQHPVTRVGSDVDDRLAVRHSSGSGATSPPGRATVCGVLRGRA